MAVMLNDYSPEKCAELVSELERLIGRLTRLSKKLDEAPKKIHPSAKQFNLKQFEDRVRKGGQFDGLLDTAFRKLEAGVLKAQGLAASQTTEQADAAEDARQAAKREASK